MQRHFSTDVTVVYEPDESGWTTATLPALPSVITAGRSREDAREKVIDALMEILAVEPGVDAGVDRERVHLDILNVRRAARDVGRDR